MAGQVPLDAWIAPTFGQRLGGRLPDGLIWLVPFLILAKFLSGVALLVVGYTAVALYEVLGLLVYGRTIGKRIVGTRVVNVGETPLGPWQAVVRFVVYGLPALILVMV